jgi:hypothetical protein
MSGSNLDWAALASNNERLAGTAADGMGPANPDAAARWAELASQRERLVEAGDSLRGLTSSRHQTSELRLAVKAA